MFDLLKENGEISLTRIIPFTSQILFIFVTLYLVISGKEWNGYTSLATAAGGGAIVQWANKWTNSKYNTPLGEGGKPEGMNAQGKE